MKRIVSLVLILALVFTFGAGSAFAAGSSAGDTTATVMKIAGFEGKVSITTEKGKNVNVSDGTKLLSGYTVKTGAASYCYISLDDAKALKLDQNTKVKIEKSGKKIEINVKSGQLFFDVDKKLSGSESMNIKTSNLTTGVRGTSGTVKVALEKVLSAMQRAGSQRSQLANMLMPKTSLQLFSGFTEVKAGAGKAVATGLSAGQQLAVNKTAETSGAGQALVKGDLVVDNFGARAIIENAAIKNGMSVGAALQASTEKIVEQVGAAVLDTLNVADSAKQQVTEMAGDPQALDKAIAEQEQQETAKTEETMQAISEAKADAGSGNASGAASEQVFEKVEVSQNATIDAGKVSFEGGSVTVEGTAAQTSGGHSGGSSSASENGIPESGYLTGYTGTYDYFSDDAHYIFRETPSAKFNESDIFVFESVAEYTSFTAILASAKENYEEVRASMAAAGESEPDYYRMVVQQGLLSNPEALRSYCNNNDLDDSDLEIGEVLYASDSGDYPYFAIEHTAPFTERTGTLHVRIAKQELSVKWIYANGSDAPNPGTFEAGTNPIPVEAIFGGTDRRGDFYQIEYDRENADGGNETINPAIRRNTGTTSGSFSIVGILVGNSNEPVSETPNFRYSGNSTYNYTLTGSTGAVNPAAEPLLDGAGLITGFADGYPQVACRADGFNITLKLAEAADTEVYGIFVGKRGNGYPDSYDVLHGHSNYVNQASALVYGRIDSADEETISIDFNEWQDADSGGFFAFILKQGNVISDQPIFVAANSQFGGLYITGTENARDTVAPRILSAFLNSARNKIVVEMSEDVAVPTNGEGFGFTGGNGTISSVSVSTTAALSGRTRYFMELGVENLEGMNMGLTYNGTAVADTSGNTMAAITAANAIPIQDSAVIIDSVAASEDRSLIRVDLTGRLLDPTTNGTYMIKYGTSWDNSTQIQGSDMDWTYEYRWNDSHTQQLGTTFFHIDEGWVPSAVPEGRFFVRLNSGSKTMALETIEVNAEPVEAASTLVATTQEPSPSAVYDSSDETLTVSFATGSMLEAGSSIVGGAVNCRFYIIDGDGKLFRLRGNYTDRGVHSLVFDNTGEYGMSGFGFDPDEVNWEGATLGYTSEIHEDDVEYFDELLAADGTIITELTDIPITVVP